MADLEFTWSTRTRPAMLALDERSRAARRTMREIERVGIELEARPALAGLPPGLTHSQRGELAREHAAARRSGAWAEARARAISLRRADVVASCGMRWRKVGCGCTALEIKVGCDQPLLCMTCRKRHSRRWSSRITAGLDHAVREERRAWQRQSRATRRGMLPGVYLVTLAGPHSGDLVEDRRRLARALRKLTKRAQAEGWWSAYAATWEATPGTDGAGHLHIHIAAVSSWIPYTEDQTGKGLGLHEAWRLAMPGALVVDVQPPRIRSDNARRVGEYLAKYATKGVEVGGFTGAKAGELLVSLRGQRRVHTSRGFWVPRAPVCECCHKRWQLTEAPCSLRVLMPGAWLAGAAERSRWRDRGRAPPQAVLPGAFSPTG
jgi:hypothetical protein